MNLLHSISNTLSNLLFPESCISCKTKGLSICCNCQKNIKPLCQYDGPKRTFAPFDYKDKIVKKSILLAKYRRKIQPIKLLTKLSADYFLSFAEENMIADENTDIILVPIPPNKTRKNVRGFNQSLLIAKELKNKLNFDKVEVENLLEKTRKTKPQASIKNKTERMKNMENAFRVAKRIKNKNVYILIDDVITTGATMNAGISAFKERGVNAWGFGLAYTKLNNKRSHENVT